MDFSTSLWGFPKYRATSRELVTGRPAVPRVTMGRRVTVPLVVTAAFNGHDVRVVMIDGAPWWVSADVRHILGITQHGRAFDFLADDEKRIVRKSGQTTFKGHGVLCLSESGLYKFVLRSDKPEARAFQDWVTRVVLPAIRKDGAYIMGEEKVATGLRFQRPRNPHPRHRREPLVRGGRRMPGAGPPLRPRQGEH